VHRQKYYAFAAVTILFNAFLLIFNDPNTRPAILSK